MNNSLVLREALLHEVGLSLTPTFIVGADIKSGKLQPVLSNYKVIEYSIYATYPQHRHLSPQVRAFIDFIANRIYKSPYLDHE